jgi:hypothetical protein
MNRNSSATRSQRSWKGPEIVRGTAAFYTPSCRLEPCSLSSAWPCSSYPSRPLRQPTVFSSSPTWRAAPGGGGGARLTQRRRPGKAMPLSVTTTKGGKSSREPP